MDKLLPRRQLQVVVSVCAFLLACTIISLIYYISSKNSGKDADRSEHKGGIETPPASSPSETKGTKLEEGLLPPEKPKASTSNNSNSRQNAPDFQDSNNTQDITVTQNPNTGAPGLPVNIESVPVSIQ